MLRIGLVGVGDAGKHHARALSALGREGLVVWSAVCARSQETVGALLREVAAPAAIRSFTSLEALLASGACDAVILATPDGLHAEQIERSADRGLAVLVEKPLALSSEAGARAIGASRRSNTHLQVGYHLRYHAAHRALMDRIDELVGPIRSIFIRWAWPDPAASGWRARGEAARFWSLAALGTHGVDLAIMLAGAAGSADIADVAALLDPPSGVDRAAEVSIRFGAPGGRALLAHISVAVTHRASSRVLVAGDAGEIEAIGTLGARGDGELFHRPPRKPPLLLPFEPTNPYEAQLRDFIRRAPAGFQPDAALLANLDVLDRIGDASPEGSS